MKMPSKTKKKWLKALRSGEYGQTRATLTNGKGSFCCLGVLQHCVSRGKVESYGFNGEYRKLPSVGWCSRNNIQLSGVGEEGDVMHDADLDQLVRMNDGGWLGQAAVPFWSIANWIEKNIETTD